MSVLPESLEAVDITDPQDQEVLQMLVGDWQLLADLSFADLVLWVRCGEDIGQEGSSDHQYQAIAHCRPTTGATVYPEDIVNSHAKEDLTRHLEKAHQTCQISVHSSHTTLRSPIWDDPPDVSVDIVPVVRAGHAVAVMTRHTPDTRRIGPSRLDRNYRSCAAMILAMIADGTFPDVSAPTGSRRGEPRVGDGVFVLTREGRIRYASPNGVSVLHRLGHEGELEGRYLAEAVSEQHRHFRPVDEGLPMILTGREPWRSEIETQRVSVSLRSLPLMRGGNRIGALVLVRDITEIRRRERELISREAVIREMHHRVKNNLQTVAALLRLQARRVKSSEAAAVLSEAQRRVEVIAVVHDALSQGIDSTVDFNDIVDRGLRLTPELSGPQQQITLHRSGDFGSISSADATALALALMELVANAIEHGFPLAEDAPPETVVTGTVWVNAERSEDLLRVSVTDDGIGLAGGEPTAGLGTSIIRTLVTTDLEGHIRWYNRDVGGTEVVIEVPLREERAS